MSDKSRDKLHDDEPESAEESAPKAETEPLRTADEPSGIPTRKSEPPPVEDDSDEPLVGQTLARRYVLEKRLGSGGMGIVFRAKDEKLGKLVALKVVRAHVLAGRGALERFYNEVKVAQDITDRGVCRVYDVGEDGPRRFLTMELIEGRTLRQLMRVKPLAVETAFGFLVQVAKGLIKVHEKGIVHRDLKPDNVMVRDDGTTVLMDFGLARHTAPEHATTTAALGTPSYMSPEQLRREHLDARSDVFSFGVMAFELLTGRLPFDGISRDDRATFVTTEWGADVVQAMESFFARALAKSRDDRFASAAEMLAAFEKARSGQTIAPVKREEAKSDAPVEKTTSTVSTKRFSRITVALVALALGVLVALIVYPRQTEISVANKAEWKILERDLLTHFDWRPIVEVRAFKNSTGEPQWNSLAESAPESLRSHLRTYPKLRITDSVPAASLKPTWIVDGTVQKMGDKLLRLSVEVHDANKTSPVPPIEVDATPTESEKTLAKARDILLDDLRRLARFKERDRKAIAGTKNEEARAKLIKYYEIAGNGPEPRNDEVVRGKALLDEALNLDRSYVPALVEHAYLLALGVGSDDRPGSLMKGLLEIDSVLQINRMSTDALEMRCRLMRAATDAERRPTDESIANAMAACNDALTAEPSSARVRLAIAMLESRMCNEEHAMRLHEEVVNFDRSLSGIVLPELIRAALNNGRLVLADRYSQELLALEANNRYGASGNRGARLFRGAVLMKLGERDSVAATAAGHEFQLEIARVNAKVDGYWFEAAAIRGLLRIAERTGSSLPRELKRRLFDLEREAKAAVALDPFQASRMVFNYQYVDPVAALEWLDQLPLTDTFDDLQLRVLLLQEAGMAEKANSMLQGFNAHQNWERRCTAWLKRRGIQQR